MLRSHGVKNATEFRNLQLFAYGNELTIRQIATAEWSAFLRAKYKRVWIGGLGSHVGQDLHSLCTQRYCAVAGPSLWFIEVSFVKRAPYTKNAGVQIDILPAQGQQFANSQAGQHKQPNQGSGWVRQSQKKRI